MSFIGFLRCKESVHYSMKPSTSKNKLWLVIFLFIYATEQILFRRDPWQLLRHTEKGGESEADAEHIPDETEETTANKEARTAMAANSRMAEIKTFFMGVLFYVFRLQIYKI